MSMLLMVKAMNTKVGNSARKLVLLKLADNANDSGECWPSYQHIADQCEMSRPTAIKHVSALEEMGLIRKVERKRDGCNLNRSNFYILTLDGKNSLPYSKETKPSDGKNSLPRTSHSLEPVNEPIDQASAFDSFWSAYPRKVGKKAALTKWKQINPNDALIAKIMQAVESHKQSDDWTRDNGKYIPHPSTWLNQGRWDDELEPAKPTTQANPAPVDKIIGLYHKICPNHPKVTVTCDETLRAMITERWNESEAQQDGNGFWVPFFRKAARRNQVFYRGQNVQPRLESLMSRAVFREIAEASE